MKLKDYKNWQNCGWILSLFLKKKECMCTLSTLSSTDVNLVTESLDPDKYVVQGPV